MNVISSFGRRAGGGSGWYDLFSRGARDWLRHNEKVREAVRRKLPELVAQADIVESDGKRRVQVPVRMLEHHRFRLADEATQTGVGQGKAKPGDILRPAGGSGSSGKVGGGDQKGGIEFVIELSVNDIVDWLWEELELPNLHAKSGGVEQDEYTREGWDRRGARSRLDRRRSLKESIKRRSIQKRGPAFIDEDLRFRQLTRRERPASEAVVFFVMDVSASMGQRERQLAKTFFFWVVQGLRRQYTHLNTVFIAHTNDAWEFSESEFFEIKGSGGTIASSAFRRVLSGVELHYPPSRYNIYLFYASDGQNFPQDRSEAGRLLTAISEVAAFGGFVQTGNDGRGDQSEMAAIFDALQKEGAALGVYQLNEDEQVWDAIRAFFARQSGSKVTP